MCITHECQLKKQKQKTKSKVGVFNWKHLWKYLGRQVIWRRKQNALLQFTKKNNEITLKQDILPKIFKSTGQIDRTIFASYETRAMNYFASLGSFRFLYLLATQDAEATGQLKTICHIARKTNLSS